ncbi:hypothetical protein K469DRAFT_712752 [Zopfia rhizophila CBS 207.26]|uniref:Uncharacterized protein n=1 Tax=Zopfia rhizophila CBS 207.26 TaxID=1314779 RepID=A0A6A6DVY8_9PEZI|nr:hypothetical protein K469DRAFT_712752 [Zopfia rhizophila CBS 207.26]
MDIVSLQSILVGRLLNERNALHERMGQIENEVRNASRTTNNFNDVLDAYQITADDHEERLTRSEEDEQLRRQFENRLRAIENAASEQREAFKARFEAQQRRIEDLKTRLEAHERRPNEVEEDQAEKEKKK